MYFLYDVSRNNTQYRFFDGPPFATGTPHYGHILIGITKDCFLKFHNMSGKSCLNKVGYDCHGVPIESIANKELNINSLEDLHNIGMEKFNGFCEKKINEFERSWEPIYMKMGRWANFNDVYKTIDKNYMESVWWGFSQLYKKNLIYRSYKVTAYSYQLQSPLSNFEATQNYKEIDTRSIYIKFKVKSSENTYFVAWTTTPWTLPCNIALCVNAELDYEYISDENGDIYILGKDKHKNCNIKNPTLVKSVKGKDLIGMKYIPIYDYFVSDRYHHIVSDNYVTDSGTAGTDIVHLAPVFGEDDYRVCKEKNIITDDDIADLEPVDENCVFLNKIKKYSGHLVFDVETDIIKELKERRIHMKTQQIKHEYPFCYRTDTPLVYKVCKSFYVDVQTIKDRMIELNKQTNWYPSNIGTGRFQKWLEGAKDWCISRSRYFGNPIPVWINENNQNDMIVIGSVEELKNLTNSEDINNLHPEHVNKLVIKKMTDEGLQTYRRVDDVFDCWFESGSMTFAQYHYPFENNNIFDNYDSMCDFICEGVDQTRGWFYTLFVLSVALFDKKPSSNIMVMGHILDSEKKKLSKKLQNYTDPTILIDTYSADAVRLYLLQSPSTYGDSLAFKEEDIKIIGKDLFQFKNCIDFLIEHITNQKHHNVIFDKNAYTNTTNPMDLWIIQHINNSGRDVINYMNKYEVARATRKLIELIEDITNWYLKFNRDRLKGKNGNDDWIMSTSVMTYIIKKYLIMLTPFAPFITQTLYTKLQSLNIFENKLKYIQQEHYEFDEIDNKDILETFKLLKKVSRLVRSSRMKTKTHTSAKTPIKYCNICMDSDIKLKQIESCIELIQSELNVIDIKYSKLSDNIKYKYVPNKALLGKKFKKNAIEIYKFFDKMTDIKDIMIQPDNSIRLCINGYVYDISESEYVKEPLFDENEIFEDDILIKIDFTYDEQIEKMQHLKRYISQIQNQRKIMGLHPWDKISIEVSQDDFNIVLENVEHMKKRLECEVNPYSGSEGNIIYEDEDSGKKIVYYIKLI
jgi:isoleucyl-tRNA synthetase